MKKQYKLFLKLTLTLLAVAGGVSYIKYKDKASQREVIALCFSAYTATQAFYFEHNQFPKDKSQLFEKPPADPHLKIQFKSAKDSFLITCANDKHAFSVNERRQLFDSKMRELPVTYLMTAKDRNDDIVEDLKSFKQRNKKSISGEVSYQ